MIPVATYRLQVSKDFTFHQAGEILDYLCALGISHIYLSPVLEAMPGSPHGYDVTDFAKVSAERGGEDGLMFLDACMAERNLRLILDIVPNHMAAHDENPYWRDVQDKGDQSPYWKFFDIRDTENGKVKTYRRFFAIDDLVGVRVEDEAIFRATHKKIIELSRKLRAFEGVRIDHIDGLADPAGYLERLQREIPQLWVEKILTDGENLPPAWPVLGTTGYDFIAVANDIFINQDNFRRIEDFWHREARPPWPDFDSCTIDSRKEVLFRLFAPELAYILSVVPDADDWDFLSRMVALPVYRTYMTGQGEEICAWQQLSSALFAKGIEDTAQYRYTPLLAMNEVGCRAGTPGTDGCRRLQDRSLGHPLTLNATSTHDTKRSEDVRARLYSLCDEPDFWPGFYRQATAVNKDILPAPLDRSTVYFLYQTILGFYPAGRDADEDSSTRLKDYMIKAARERHQKTAWDNPDPFFEESLCGFIDKILADEKFNTILKPAVAATAQAGAVNSLSVLILKILGGGVPDFYQGAEDWHFTLVDPDNRRPADFRTLQERWSALKEIHKNRSHTEFLEYLVNAGSTGLSKLWLTARLLQIRKAYNAPLQITSMLPVKGPLQNHILACTITGHGGNHPLHVILPLFPRPLLRQDTALSVASAPWEDTAIGTGTGRVQACTCLLQGRDMAEASVWKAKDVFAAFPAALLTQDKEWAAELAKF